MDVISIRHTGTDTVEAHVFLPEESSFPESTTNRRWIIRILLVHKHVSQLSQLLRCVKAVLPLNCADVTGLPVQPLTTMTTLHKFVLLCLWSRSFSLFHFSVSLFLSLFSQLDSRDNNGVTVSFLQILFLQSARKQTLSPPGWSTLCPFSCPSLFSCRPKALSLRQSHC